MGLACAMLAKCPWCIRSCIRDGLQEGVIKEEIVEAINIAMVMNASAVVANTDVSMGSLGADGLKRGIFPLRLHLAIFG
ncbi:MAG: carboxymuconolactone decarboxylase family protein [Thermodesulfobacteriota bacterium]